MPLPKAVLFDLDDTILAFSIASSLAWEKSCEEFILKNAVGFDIRTLLKTVSETREWYWSDPVRNKNGRGNLKNARREVFRIALSKLDYHIEESIIETADRYNALQESFWSLFDGLPQAFEILQKINIRMAIVTNGVAATQRGKLERFHITDFFEQVIIDTEVGVSKPDAGIFRIALDRLALSPMDVWMVGDNLAWDVEAPQSIGIFSVWNDFSGKGLPDGLKIKPDMIVGSVYQMVRNIESMR